MDNNNNLNKNPWAVNKTTVTEQVISENVVPFISGYSVNIPVPDNSFSESYVNSVARSVNQNEFIEKYWLKRLSNGVGTTYLSYFVVMFSLAIFSSIFFGLVMAIAYPNITAASSTEITNTYQQILGFFLTIISIGLPFLLFIKHFEIPMKFVIPNKKMKPVVFISTVVIAFGIIFIANIASQYLLDILKYLGINIKTPENPIPKSLIGMIFFAINPIILAPIFEEFAFRGVILSSLKRFGNLFAIIVSAMLFSLAHGSIPSLIPTFIMGVITGYFVIKYKNIWIGVAIHFINNLFAVVMSFLPQYTTESVINLIGYIVVGVAIFGAIAFITINISRQTEMFSMEKSNSNTSSVKSFRRFIFSPMVMVALVVGLGILTLNTVLG